MKKHGAGEVDALLEGGGEKMEKVQGAARSEDEEKQKWKEDELKVEVISVFGVPTTKRLDALVEERKGVLDRLEESEMKYINSFSVNPVTRMEEEENGGGGRPVSLMSLRFRIRGRGRRVGTDLRSYMSLPCSVRTSSTNLESSSNLFRRSLNLLSSQTTQLPFLTYSLPSQLPWTSFLPILLSTSTSSDRIWIPLQGSRSRFRLLRWEGWQAPSWKPSSSRLSARRSTRPRPLARIRRSWVSNERRIHLGRRLEPDYSWREGEGVEGTRTVPEGENVVEGGRDLCFRRPRSRRGFSSDATSRRIGSHATTNGYASLLVSSRGYPHPRGRHRRSSGSSPEKRNVERDVARPASRSDRRRDAYDGGRTGGQAEKERDEWRAEESLRWDQGESS